MTNNNIEKINDSIFMSNIGVLYDGILKLSEILDSSPNTKCDDNLDISDKSASQYKRLENLIKGAYGETDDSPRQNVLYSYITFIKQYVNNRDHAIDYTDKLYRLYRAARDLANSSLQQIRENLQEVAKSAGSLMEAEECYIVYFDEHTQTATEIAWDCRHDNYEDGGKYSEYIGSILQGIHQNELKIPTQSSRNIFSVEEIGWSCNIEIVDSSSNVRVLEIRNPEGNTVKNKTTESEDDATEKSKTYLISVKLPIEFNKKLQNGISVYFIFQIENDEHLLEKNGKHRYCSGSWRFRVRSFNTFYNTLVNGLSKNIAYILSEKFFYPRLKNTNNDGIINILHISDIHYKTATTTFKESQLDKYNPDLLVVTGDLVQADGNANTIAERYEQCKKELIKLAKQLFKYEWRDRVLIIPGNHDYASMNEVIANDDGRAFSGAKPPKITDIVNPRVKFAYYLGFVSSFRRDFFNSNRYIDYDINYIDNRFDDWGISFLLLNSSSGVSAYRHNKVALSKSKISMLSNKMDDDMFNICLIHHTPLFNIMYIKDRSSVFAPIQDAYLTLFYDENWKHKAEIKDNVIKLCNTMKILNNGVTVGCTDSWGDLHKKILNYDLENEVSSTQSSEFVIKERIIWFVLELVCARIYNIISENEGEQELCVKEIKKFIELIKDNKKAEDGKKLLEKVYQRHSEVLGRIAQEKMVADDDSTRYCSVIKELIEKKKVNLFMGGHQHTPSFCVSQNKKSDAIKYSLNDNLFSDKKVYISEAGKFFDFKTDINQNVFSFNIIRIDTENASCECEIVLNHF